MTPTPIRNAAARAFWEAAWLAQASSPTSSETNNGRCYFEDVCDGALDEWALRFGDAQLIEDIEANKARRGVQ